MKKQKYTVIQHITETIRLWLNNSTSEQRNLVTLFKICLLSHLFNDCVVIELIYSLS